VDVQAEADRLIGLDQSGRDREMVVVALRLGQQAQRSWDEIRKLDEELLYGLTGVREGNVGSPEGEEPVPEYVDS
jgi:hypothetical protein